MILKSYQCFLKIYYPINWFKSRIDSFILPYEYQTRKCGEEVLLPQKKITNILNGLKIENYDLTSVFCDQNEPKELFINLIQCTYQRMDTK